MLTLALILMVVVPALAGVLAGVLRSTASRAVAVAASVVVAALAVWATATGYGGTHSESVGDMPWLGGPATTSVFGVLLDPLASILLLVVTIIGLLTVVYSTRYLGTENRDHQVAPSEHPRYYFWLLLFLASMVGVAVSPNFLQLFFFWELTTVCSWALISFYRNEKSLAAGFKALVMTQVGGAFFLVAILILFARTGSFEFGALALLPDRLRLLVFFLLLLAAWAKAAQVPFHTWLPDAMEAPTPISAYLHAAAMVKAGVFLMARSVSSGWAMPTELGMVMGAMAVVTLFIALSYYFVQDDLKRLLAYSTIAHLGYVLLGISLGALGSTVGFRGGVLHIICHGFSKATLFLCVGAIAYVTGSRSISALGGLAKHAADRRGVLRRRAGRHRRAAVRLLLEQVHDPRGRDQARGGNRPGAGRAGSRREPDRVRLDAARRAEGLPRRAHAGGLCQQRPAVGDERRVGRPDDRVPARPGRWHPPRAADRKVTS